MSKKLATIISTCGYLGKIKYAPGTIGSLIAFPFTYLILTIILKYNLTINLGLENMLLSEVISVFLSIWISITLLFIVGIIGINSYIKYYGNLDHKEIIIDELVGQMITITLCAFSIVVVEYYGWKINKNIVNIIFLFILPFACFRFCDIIKPWPICWLDKNITGAIGIMLDDVAAAFFASLFHYGITFAICSFV